MRSVAAVLFTLACVTAVRAHPLAPSLLEAVETAPGIVRLRWKTPSKRVPGSRLAPVLPSDCHVEGDPVTTIGPTDVVTEWDLRCPAGTLVGRTLAVDDISSSKAAVLIRVQLADGRRLLHVLRAEEASYVIPARPVARTVVWNYGQLGVRHILSGPDHLLFVLGLVLLVGGGRSLLWTVTAFTVGHSVTLSLAVLGIVDFPSQLIEVLIACSIFVLAIELTRPGPRQTLLGRYPWAMAGTFGLLHGLGFAGALAEVGLPSGDIPLALLSFNVGIEVGQLVFVFAALVTGRLLGPVGQMVPTLARLGPPYVIGSLSVFWMLERITGG